MAKLPMIVTVASAAVVAGGFALASADLVGDRQSAARQDRSVIVAVAPPHRALSTDRAFDRAPALPKTSPLPRRTPDHPMIDMALEVVVSAKPALVRAGPSESAAMLYGFPAHRPMRMLDEQNDFARIIDVRSGAQGWIEKSALASKMMTASVESKRVAKADIDESPKPVTGIPKKKQYNPMLLGGGDPDRSASHRSGGTNFASFVRRGFGSN